MIRVLRTTALAGVLSLAAMTGASAQGVPTEDLRSIANAIQQLDQMKQDYVIYSVHLRPTLVQPSDFPASNPGTGENALDQSVETLTAGFAPWMMQERASASSTRPEATRRASWTSASSSRSRTTAG
ncbi:hypothetical protein [Falsirhodobacter sp. 1013]|uniref:hypothetical protein n=1 Tax=Falsirhodobacter sp. 1013 TaxID=3417566 RepID=UPI003EBD8436